VGAIPMDKLAEIPPTMPRVISWKNVGSRRYPLTAEKKQLLQEKKC